jgi:hypothetical protein
VSRSAALACLPTIPSARAFAPSIAPVSSGVSGAIASMTTTFDGAGSGNGPGSAVSVEPEQSAWTTMSPNRSS